MIRCYPIPKNSKSYFLIKAKQKIQGGKENETVCETYGIFSFELSICDGYNELKVSFSTDDSTVATVCLTSSEGGCTGEVRIVGGNILKYETRNNYLKLAASILNTGKVQMEFVRNADQTVTGYVYEYLTALEKDVVSASAMLQVTESYVSIVGTKGDFCSVSKNNRNVEIYDAKTAKLLIGRVYEDVTTVQYDTYWLPITDLPDIFSVKKIDEENGSNPDTVYINGSSTPFEVEYNKFLTKNTSRWFDIEFKTVYAYCLDEDGDLVRYFFEMPMLFVQTNRYDDFLDKLYENNKNVFSASPTRKTQDTEITQSKYCYETLVPLYNAVKDAVTSEAISEYLGISNEEDGEE